MPLSRTHIFPPELLIAAALTVYAYGSKFCSGLGRLAPTGFPRQDLTRNTGTQPIPFNVWFDSMISLMVILSSLHRHVELSAQKRLDISHENQEYIERLESVITIISWGFILKSLYQITADRYDAQVQPPPLPSSPRVGASLPGINPVEGKGNKKGKQSIKDGDHRPNGICRITPDIPPADPRLLGIQSEYHKEVESLLKTVYPEYNGLIALCCNYDTWLAKGSSNISRNKKSLLGIAKKYVSFLKTVKILLDYLNEMNEKEESIDTKEAQENAIKKMSSVKKRILEYLENFGESSEDLSELTTFICKFVGIDNIEELEKIIKIKTSTSD